LVEHKILMELVRFLVEHKIWMELVHCLVEHMILMDYHSDLPLLFHHACHHRHSCYLPG